MAPGSPTSPELERIRARLRQVRDPLALLEGIFTFAPVGFQIYAADGHCVLVNDAFRRLFGAEPPPEYDVRRDEIAERNGFLGLIRRAFAGETVHIPAVWYDPRELEHVRVEQGNRVAVESTLFPLLDAAGAVTHVAIVFNDVTAETLAREQLEQARAEAERQRDLLREEARSKDQFLATLSHELRTPLHAIVGWAHLLHIGGLDAEASHRAVDAVRRNASVLGRLIADLLDVSRIVSGKLKLDVVPTDLAAVCRAALESMAHAAEARRITLRGEIPDDLPPVAADPTRLQQVLGNLLGNAVKFTGEGGHVCLRVAREERGLSVEVIDDGPGIPPGFLSHVFEPFRQADASTTRTHGGMGLGLALVRRLVEMHGGRVDAANRPEGGARLAVWLPLRAATAASVTAERGAGSVRGLRVLAVDDDPEGLELLRDLLDHDGARVVVAARAAEAWPHLEAGTVDVLLCDVGMPGEDGYSLVRRLRAVGGARGAVAAVALTAHASAEDRDHALAAGFDAHLAKPATAEDVRRAVASALSARR